jgi:hypothetical protein
MEVVTSNTLYPHVFAAVSAAETALICWRGLSIGSAAAPCEQEMRKLMPSSDRRLGLRQASYSIRLPETPGEVGCARCDALFRAAGPTGHLDEQPICDLCLLECEKELGMVLALVSVVRAYASMHFGSAKEHWEALEEVGAFAHIFEQVATARSGPGRLFRPDLSQDS